MKKPAVDFLRRTSLGVVRAVLIIAAVLTIYFRIANVEILSDFGTRLLEFSPIIFVIYSAMLVGLYIWLMLWLIKYDRRKGDLGKLFASLNTLRLGIVSFFAGAALIGILLWGLVKLLRNL